MARSWFSKNEATGAMLVSWVGTSRDVYSVQVITYLSIGKVNSRPKILGGGAILATKNAKRHEEGEWRLGRQKLGKLAAPGDHLRRSSKGKGPDCGKLRVPEMPGKG